MQCMQIHQEFADVWHELTHLCVLQATMLGMHQPRLQNEIEACS